MKGMTFNQKDSNDKPSPPPPPPLPPDAPSDLTKGGNKPKPR